MHAVIRTGGKQYRVAEGDVLRVEKLDAESGSKLDLEEVLLVSDGDKVQVGSPLVDGGKVTVEVRAHGRGDKIDVIKFKRRKKYRRKYGHRQDYTELQVTGISAGAKGAPGKKAEAKTEKAADAAEKKAAPKKAETKKAAPKKTETKKAAPKKSAPSKPGTAKKAAAPKKKAASGAKKPAAKKSSTKKDE